MRITNSNGVVMFTNTLRKQKTRPAAIVAVSGHHSLRYSLEATINITTKPDYAFISKGFRRYCELINKINRSLNDNLEIAKFIDQ